MSAGPSNPPKTKQKNQTKTKTKEMNESKLQETEDDKGAWRAAIHDITTEQQFHSQLFGYFYATFL